MVINKKKKHEHRYQNHERIVRPHGISIIFQMMTNQKLYIKLMIRTKYLHFNVPT